MAEQNLVDVLTKEVRVDDQTFRLTLRLFESAGNDHVRVDATFIEGLQETGIGGADILLFPLNPTFLVIPHQAADAPPGIVLGVSSAIVGAIGPIAGRCIGSENEQGRYRIRSCIKLSSERMLDEAIAAVTECFKIINANAEI